MNVIYRLSYIDTDVRMIFYCPGCKHEHAYRIQEADKPVGAGPIWNWNGSYEKPSFSPSLLNTWPDHSTEPPTKNVCHLYVNDGVIDFLGDCTHELRGTQVVMVEAINQR